MADTAPPTVSLSSSTTNVTTASTITLTANASDNVGVSKVEFFEASNKIGEDTSASDGFIQAVSFTISNNGNKSYTAKAFDAAGNSTTSTAVAVTINIPLPGSLDTSFGTGGIVSTDFDENRLGQALAIQSDGKIVVVGDADNSGNYDFKVVRYLANGAPDPSFGTGGKVTTDFASDTDQANSVVIQPDGKIVVVGNSRYFDSSFSTYNTDLAVARYHPDGSLDKTFDGDGKTTTELGSLSDVGTSVTLQPDGKIVAVGMTGVSPSEPVIAVVRYNTNGSPDNTFDSDGKKVDDIVRNSARFVTVQPSGNIVVGGNSRYQLFLQRYTPTGQRDNSFGQNIDTGPITGMTSMTATSMVVQPDGKIVLTGTGAVGSTDGLQLGFVVRVDPNGKLDNSFDGDGIARIDFSPAAEEVHSAMIQSDGKILLLGIDNGNPVLIRLNSTGSLDTSYGTGGKVPAALGYPVGSSSGVLNGQATKMQSDGKVVVGVGPVWRLNP